MATSVKPTRNILVHFEPALHRAVRVEALKNGMTLTQYLRAAALKYLDTDTQEDHCVATGVVQDR